ncbi:MAG: hypothetical protein KAT58_08015 [candidate division Zixibacteria bacterium]|nr:hypothetical protein [candidate division Zixibacteria bacterium]
MSTEEKYEQLTQNHAAALVQMGEYERKRKKDRWTIIVSLLGVLGVGSGGGAAYLQNSSQGANLETVVATHIATQEQWQAGVDADIEKMMESVDALKLVVVRLQVLGETSDHDEIDILLRKIEARSQRKLSKASAADVRRVQEQLFAD